MRVRYAVVFAFLSLFTASAASGEPITFAFSGTIEFASGAMWVPGDHVEGNYTFEAGTPGVIPVDGVGVSYDAISDFLVSAGSTTIAGSAGTISVHLNEPSLGGETGYDVRMRWGSAGTSWWDVFLSVFDQPGFSRPVTDTSIQRSPPSLANVTFAGGTILGRGGEYLFSLDRLERVVVPEPETLLLLAIGLSFLAILQRRLRGITR